MAGSKDEAVSSIELLQLAQQGNVARINDNFDAFVDALITEFESKPKADFGGFILPVLYKILESDAGSDKHASAAATPASFLLIARIFREPKLYPYFNLDTLPDTPAREERAAKGLLLIAMPQGFDRFCCFIVEEFKFNLEQAQQEGGRFFLETMRSVLKPDFLRDLEVRSQQVCQHSAAAVVPVPALEPAAAPVPPPPVSKKSDGPGLGFSISPALLRAGVPIAVMLLLAGYAVTQGAAVAAVMPFFEQHSGIAGVPDAGLSDLAPRA